MADFGTLTLYALLLLSTWSGAMALVGARRRSRPMVEAARHLLNGTAAMSSVSILVLTYAFAASDFSLSYVQRYSEWAMPMFYKLTAVWGGQQGSLLLWAWLLAVMAAGAVHVNRDRLRELVPYVIVVLTVVIDFFCLLLLSASPFDTFLVEVPTAGQGLNPLLQNAYMVTHPPALYVGYVGMAIPFAFAMAALITGQTDDSWIHAARPWALASWYFLSMGLVLGMLWAYEELGWGGYWGWDPVENAGLIPWLTSTAYIHSVMVQERRQMLRTWNMVLAILTFELTIFGTFLTRSGFIQSVHAFAQSDIGWYFLGFMGIVALVALALIIWRQPLLRSRGLLDSALSREFVVVLNNWVLLAAAFLVLVLTIFPSVSQRFGNKINISAPAFNLWMVPIGLILLFLKGFGPMVGWGKTTRAGLLRQMLIPAVAATVGTGILLLLGVHGARPTTINLPPLLTVIWRYLPLFTFALCTFVAVQVLQELIRGVAIRRRQQSMDPLTALVRLIGRNRRRYGGYIVHLGVVLMFLGFAGEGYKDEAELLMKSGQRATVGRYTLRYDGIENRVDDQKRMLTATLSVYTDGGRHRLGTIHPARWVYFKHEGQPTTEVDIRRSAREDLFVVLGDYDEKLQAASIKIIVNPLVNWIWIGFVLLTLGIGIAMAPTRLRTRARTGGVSTAIMLALALVLAVAGPTWARGESQGHGAEVNEPERAHGSVLELRLFHRLACMCPTCPRIPLATCQCGFAGKERNAIRKKIAAGWSEERILDWYLKQRGPELGREPFGASALTTPPDTGFNRLSWLIPYGLSLVALVGLIWVARRWTRRRRSSTSADDEPLAEGGQIPAKQQQEYDNLLERELKKLD